jgi:hypothetical protein
MKILKQYIEVIDFFKVKEPEINAIIGGQNTKLRQYFDGITQDMWQTDDEAAAALYGAECDASHPSFRVLKTELKRKLHFIMGGAMDYRQHDEMTEFRQTFYIAVRQQAVLKILIARGKFFAALDLAHGLCDLAMKFEFSEPIVAATAMLKRHYLTRMPDAKKYAYYKELNERYTRIFQAERMANDFQIEIAATYIDSRAAKNWLKPIIDGYIQQLSIYKNVVDSAVFIYDAGMLEIWSCIVINDYERCLGLCDECINRLEKKHFRHDAILFGLVHRKVVCCIMLKKYVEAVTTVEKAMTLVQVNTHNWFVNNILYIQLSFHTKDYRQAIKKCLEVGQSPDFAYQTKSTTEEFKICEAYLQWMVSYNKIKVTKAEKEALGQFKITRIINELPTFSKDKKGMNIPILMLQVLWLLAEKRYDEFLERLDALSKYKTRYLKDTENLRTNLLIKLLYQIPENGYDKRKVLRKIDALLKRLVDAPKTSYEIEVFPYDIYWNLVVETL